jgi:hypothetical protein
MAYSQDVQGMSCLPSLAASTLMFADCPCGGQYEKPKGKGKGKGNGKGKGKFQRQFVPKPTFYKKWARNSWKSNGSWKSQGSRDNSW